MVSDISVSPEIVIVCIGHICCWHINIKITTYSLETHGDSFVNLQ